VPIFAIEAENKLKEVSETGFSIERDIQKITENNLKTIYKLRLVRPEFELRGLRIDTLAFDEETKSFVIIEYKKGENYSVIDQGFAYLNLLLNNKADFVLEYRERTKENLGKNDVDWSQSRVIFISPNFTKYQKQAISFKDLPMELWEVHRYGNGTVLYTQLQSLQAEASISTITQKSELVAKVSEEVKKYTEEYHKEANGNPKVIELYDTMKSRILDLGGDIRIQPVKFYISFKRHTNFVDIEFQRSRLKVHINMPKAKLDDPNHVTRDVSRVGHFGMGDYEAVVETPSDVENAMYLVKQSYSRN
jgi:predicted transport protein